MVLVAVRPRNIGAWVWPVAGAVLLIVLGSESLPSALNAVERQWNVLIFILGLMAISVAAERSGLFAWVAERLLAHAKGSRRRLFTWIFLTGAALTTILSNDATAIVFTPVVYRAIASRGIDALPFLYACTFVADTASFGLPFSNPANLLVIPRPHLAAFVLHLGLPMIVAVGLNLAIFLALFRGRLRDRYQPVEPPPKLGGASRGTAVAMLVVALAYVGALFANVPLGPVALGGSLLVLAVARVRVRDAFSGIGWSTFALLAGMFVLLDAVVHLGIVSLALGGLHDAARGGFLSTMLAAAFGSALASNLLNNLPVAVISGAVVAHGAGAVPLAYPLIAGVDLGPNLTTTGSLATILWLSIVRARGVVVSPLEYFRLGLCVVPPTLLVASLWLWIVK
jgi:arsenical pump membrane protein